jgi:hypothetical protein
MPIDSKPGNPQFKKVAERVGGWVHGLGVPVGVRPNHAWRHVFKSVARHVRMDREVEGFITGHRPKDSNAGNDYGDRWINTMSANIEKYPRYKIAALGSLPALTSVIGVPRPRLRLRRSRRKSARLHARDTRRGCRLGSDCGESGTPSPMPRSRENRRKTRIPKKSGRIL